MYVSALLTSQSRRLIQQKCRLTGFCRPPQFVINLPRQRAAVLSSVPLLQPSNFPTNFSSSRKGRARFEFHY